MALNVIWISFFLIGILTALFSLIVHGNTDPFSDMTSMLVGGPMSDGSQTDGMARVAATISLGYIGLMALWLGIMKIGEDGGAVRILTKLVSPFFRCLFPGIPKDHPASGSIMMNFSANMLGLDNAATPLGLKAMDELQSLNNEKDRATDAQIMFLVLNTSGLTIIPISVITLRAVNGAANPTDIFVPILIATYCATLVGLISVAIVQRINLFKPAVFIYLGVATALIAGMIVYFTQVSPVPNDRDNLTYTTDDIVNAKALPEKLTAAENNRLQSLGAQLSRAENNDQKTAISEKAITQFNGSIEEGGAETRLDLDSKFEGVLKPIGPKLVARDSKTLAALIIFGLLGAFFALAIHAKINLYESFITGAKDGFGVAVKIIPYLVAMLVAVGIFRASGAMDIVMNTIAKAVAALGLDTAFVDALPTAAMKPLSGSGARGLAVETMVAHGPDSFAGKLACTFQGSTETTFYTLAVYFGAVGVTRTRYTIFCGLLADLAGIIAAIFVAYLFFK
ncbi:MAG: nucleoside recognition domain-containing protein [Verrucomicrobiota bacterium]